MKACVIICVVAIAALAVADKGDEGREKLKKLRAECNADPATAVSDELIEKSMKGELTEADTPKVGAHAKCVAVKLDLIDANGVVNQAKLREIISRDITDESKVNDIVQKCSEPKATSEATAIKVFKCLARVRGAPKKLRHD